jgi:NAD(P)-dependent dehydrogenase (short-subunit alcohol dehydrogenase family)
MRQTRAEDGRWTAANVPDQSGRVAVVTGASGGIGLETALVLARRGATVILACRDMRKAGQAAARIRAEAARVRAGGAKAQAGTDSVRIVHLDLAALASVREAAGEIRSACPRLDLLINNAGVMAPPYQRTVDGFELTFATNHLGPFALTGLVLDRLLATAGSRVVTVSSSGHTGGVMAFDDLHFERGYHATHAYWQSKLANLLFSYELQARLDAAGAATMALAAHPGVVPTELWRTSSGLERALISPRLRLLNFWIAQDARMGALPTLRAAVDPSARGGEYYGPAGRHDTGYPVRVESSARSHDTAAQQRLWEISEQLTRVPFRIPEPSAGGESVPVG